MTLEVWLDAVKEGRKGDILALYCLSLLLDIHTAVHLHNGGMWTTLQVVPDNHDSMILCCGMHLAYLGMGIFMELVRREIPLTILPATITSRPDIKSIVVGEVTLMKSNISSSMGTETPQHLPGTSKYGEAKVTIPTVKTTPTTLMKEKKANEQPPIQCKTCKVVLKQLMLSNDIQSVIVTKTLLDALPISKYRKNWDNYYLEGVIVNNLDSKTKWTGTEESEGYSSDDTVLYNWIPPTVVHHQGKKKNTEPRRRSTFNINVIGIL